LFTHRSMCSGSTPSPGVPVTYIKLWNEKRRDWQAAQVTLDVGPTLQASEPVPSTGSGGQAQGLAGHWRQTAEDWRTARNPTPQQETAAVKLSRSPSVGEWLPPPRDPQSRSDGGGTGGTLSNPRRGLPTAEAYGSQTTGEGRAQTTSGWIHARPPVQEGQPQSWIPPTTPAPDPSWTGLGFHLPSTTPAPGSGWTGIGYHPSERAGFGYHPQSHPGWATSSSTSTASSMHLPYRPGWVDHLTEGASMSPGSSYWGEAQHPCTGTEQG
jgi:hypothetical protein